MICTNCTFFNKINNFKGKESLAKFTLLVSNKWKTHEASYAWPFNDYKAIEEDNVEMHLCSSFLPPVVLMIQVAYLLKE